MNRLRAWKPSVHGKSDEEGSRRTPSGMLVIGLVSGHGAIVSINREREVTFRLCGAPKPQVLPSTP